MSKSLLGLGDGTLLVGSMTWKEMLELSTLHFSKMIC